MYKFFWKDAKFRYCLSNLCDFFLRESMIIWFSYYKRKVFKSFKIWKKNSKLGKKIDTRNTYLPLLRNFDVMKKQTLLTSVFTWLSLRQILDLCDIMWGIIFSMLFNRHIVKLQAINNPKIPIFFKNLWRNN